MVAEKSTRRPEFVEGRAVRLTDGQEWSLPIRDPARHEPEYDALLSVICEVEDRAEGMLAELALTIFLLNRNYDLAPTELARLLDFPSNDPGLCALQDTVHGVVLESLRRLHREPPVARPGETPAWGVERAIARHRTWSLRGLLGLR